MANLISRAQKVLRMAHRAWHSADSKVYHDAPDCTVGNNIEPENILYGTGSKRRCRQCARLRLAA